MRIMGRGSCQPVPLPIVQESVTHRIVQIYRDILRTISQCFASIPVLRQVFAPCSVAAPPSSVKKGSIQSAIAALKQCGYAHKNKGVAAIAIGVISFLIYPLAKRHIEIAFNQLLALHEIPVSSSPSYLTGYPLKNIFIGSLAALVVINSALLGKDLWNERKRLVGVIEIKDSLINNLKEQLKDPRLEEGSEEPGGRLMGRKFLEQWLGWHQEDKKLAQKSLDRWPFF